MLSHCPQTCFVISVAAAGPVGPRMISIGHKKENVKRIEVAELAKRLQPALETLRMLGDSCFLLNNEFGGENLFLLYIFIYLYLCIYIYISIYKSYTVISCSFILYSFLWPFTISYYLMVSKQTPRIDVWQSKTLGKHQQIEAPEKLEQIRMWRP